VRDESEPEQHRGLAMGAEEPHGQEHAGKEHLHGDGDGAPVADADPKYTQPIAASWAPKTT
jgi:hypothetical protein